MVLLKTGFQSYPIIFTASAFVGVSTMIFLYCFFLGRLWDLMLEVDLVKKIANFSKGFFYDMVARGLIGKIEKFNRENIKNRKVTDNMEKSGKVLRYIMVFASTLNPVPFSAALFWVPCIVFCRASNWRTGLMVMIAGDILKNAVMAYLWLNVFWPQMSKV